ncbi:MAG: ABC transporter permease [Treponema sp.]|uniref:ABC transporter permease n=1 Tax=Treponema sp. TaxID=166 RepID=UPI003FA2035E
MRYTRYLLIISSACAFCAVLAAFFIPMGAAVLPVFNSGLSETALRSILRVAIFTIVQAFLSATGAGCIGLCAAFFCARRKFFGRKFLLALSAIPLSVPPVVIALAFILFFGKNGMLNRLLAQFSADTVSIGTFLYSMGGVLLVHSFYNFPITMRTVAVAWEKLPEEPEQAACLLGASPLHIFRTIIFPALKVPFFASFVIIFLYCFFSFVIILLLGGLGVTTLEVELYQTVRREIHAQAAAWIALIETVIAAAAVGLYAYLRSRTADHTDNAQYLRTRTRICGKLEKLMFCCLVCIIGCCLILPLFSLLAYSFSTTGGAAQSCLPQYAGLKAWQQIIQRPAFWYALKNTVQTGIGTAAMSVLAALLFAAISVFTRLHWLKSLPFLPFTVSSIVIGSGWLRLDAAPSPFLLIAAQSSLAWPFAWAQIEASLAKIPHSVLDAAFILSASRSEAFFRTVLPLCKTGIVSAFCCVFAISAGDASLPILLHIPNFENLALMLFRFAGSYRFTESAGIAVILAMITGFLFFVQDTVKESV